MMHGVKILPDREAKGAATVAEPDSDFCALFTTHPTPMWVYDPATLRFLAVNDAALDLYGYDRDAYASMTVLDIRPPGERERMLKAIRERTDIERQGQWQHLKASGEIIHVVTYGRDVMFQGVPAILAIVTDQTEITEAVKKANHTQSLLDSIVEHLPVGVFVKDMQDDGRYILYNRACGVVVGYDPAELVGRVDRDVFSATNAAEFRQQDLAVMADNRMLEVEEEIVRADGTVRLVRTVKRPIPAADGSSPRYLLGLSDDVTERRSYEKHIAHVAMHDSLTGLPNRAFFTSRLRELTAQTHSQRSIALLYLDIDHFKNINDSLGHPAGDELLCEVASRLESWIGSGDVVARLGGDEFAVALRLGTDGRCAESCAQSVMALFRAPFHLDGAQEYVTCSVGIAVAPKDGDDETVLLRNADLALYAAKSDGRSTYAFYEDAMRHKAKRRHMLSGQLRKALDRREFELHYQPIISLSNDSISGFEALIRWRHPQRGLISPNEFVPVAEETGLIVAMGDWVLREACRCAAGWQSDIKVAVNLSACQFKGDGLLTSVMSALAASGLRPNRLELEITESVFLSENKHNIHLLHDLRNLGVRIAMDDFGTGYSSLSYLRAFPFDKIKMDRSFIANIESEPGSLSIVRAAIALGSGFSLETTAEGVETFEQLQRLRRERCGEAQGFFIGRPMPSSEIERFIEHGMARGHVSFRR